MTRRATKIVATLGPASSDPALLEKAMVGDKVRFKAEKSGGALVVTDMQSAK